MTTYPKAKKTGDEIARAKEDRAFFASMMLLLVVDIVSSAIGKFTLMAQGGQDR